MGKLTARQAQFCEEYLIDLNATKAAERAGFSAKTARSQGQRLLTNVDIQQYLQEQRNKTSSKLEITRERVAAEYAKIAFSDIRNLYDDNNAIIPMKSIDDETAAALASVEVFEEFSGRGDEREHVGNTIKVKMYDKKGALDSICKMFGFNAPEKTEHSGTVITVGYGDRNSEKGD